MRFTPMHMRFLLGLLAFSAIMISCRKEEVIASGNLDLRFSTDTVLVDSTFLNIGSSTYTLKVYNDKDQTVNIDNIRLGRPRSPFRVNINGEPAASIDNVRILPNDSIYIFVEVTTNRLQVNNELVAEDDLIFSSGERSQEVKLLAPAQDAIFHFPTNFLVLGRQAIPYSVIDCNTTWTPGRPHVVYGYAVVDENCNLTIQGGTNVHFSQNSGMWVFDGGKLDIAPGSPAGGDSVTFSSDRLEPFYSDVPGQWGGVLGGLYISQRGQATINNLVLKNATTGLRVDSAAFQDQLIISNSKILNSSRIGLYGGYGNVDAENLIVANAGLYLLYAYGGNYSFRQCTFANFWSQGTRQEPAVLLTNFTEVQNQNGQTQRLVRDLNSCNFDNSVIYGNNNIEFALQEDNSGQLNFKFRNALIKTDPEDPSLNYSVTDPEFINVSTSQDPDFVNPNESNYAPDSLSQIVDQGDPGIIPGITTDIRGNGRNFNGRPDLGAIERQY